MREILASINKKKHVKLGNHVFSPLMELSNGIVLNYCDNLYLNKCKKVPLVLCFPKKKGAAIWTSIITLTNAFLEDYIENNVESVKYNNGDKVSIYGCVCRISRVSKNHIELEFKDQTISIQESINDFLKKMNKVSNARSLNKISKYHAGLKNAKINRNSISKILIPNDPEIINQNNLDSKVLLIAGRGNVKKFYNLLDTTVFYDEKLSKTFGVGKNLIIKPDLKPFIDLFKGEIKLKYEGFKKVLKLFLEIDNEQRVKSTVCSFLERLEKENRISQDFEYDFLSFIDEFEEEVDELKFVLSKFPGVQESLPKKLKAVIINDIGQLNEFPETIEGFLSQHIPVIIVSNRKVSNINEVEFYDKLFSSKPDYYRINWNRKKIQGLIKCEDSGVNYIDEELWAQSKRYASQKINIIISDGSKLDEIIGQLLNTIKELDEFEILQKAFYNYFYPALYALKNSNIKSVEVTQLAFKFKSVFDKIKGSGLPQSTVVLFETAIRLVHDFEVNSKKYNPDLNIFSNNLISSNSNDVYIPCDTCVKNLPSTTKKDLIFTGYPYQEYSGKYLLNSVCADFIPNITILCWPQEGTLTINYLKRRLKAAYFSDKIDNELNFPSEFLLKEKIEFITEINSFLNIDSAVVEDGCQEENLNYLHMFKYKGYSHNGHEVSIFKVKCQILNFTDGTFMFLPKNSKILAEKESTSNTIKISNLQFTELARGLRIFKYIKDRSLYKKLSLKNDEIYKAYDLLEIWREKLDSIFKLCNENIEKVKNKLTESKDKLNIKEAKPTLSNIRNWLFDDDMIMPDRENVKLIISTANNSVIDSDYLDKLVESYRRVKANRIHLAHIIKRAIITRLVKSKEIIEGEVEINLEGVLVSVEVKTIGSLDSSDYEIEYQNTRKILC